MVNENLVSLPFDEGFDKKHMLHFAGNIYFLARVTYESPESLKMVSEFICDNELVALGKWLAEMQVKEDIVFHKLEVIDPAHDEAFHEVNICDIYAYQKAIEELVEDLPEYEIEFGHPIEPSENCDDWIVHNGKEYQYEITLSDIYPDNKCCRVKIDGIYYYFG